MDNLAIWSLQSQGYQRISRENILCRFGNLWKTDFRATYLSLGTSFFLIDVPTTSTYLQGSNATKLPISAASYIKILTRYS